MSSIPEKWTVVLLDPTIQNLIDPRIIDYAPGLPLLIEPRAHLTQIQTRLQSLEGNTAVNWLQLFGLNWLFRWQKRSIFIGWHRRV